MKILKKETILTLLFVAFLSTVSLAQLTPGSYFFTSDNTTIPNIPTKTLAVNGSYSLIFQQDGNLVLYNGSTALWASNTTGAAVTPRSIKFWNLGSVTIGGWDAQVQSHIAGRPVWVLQGDGNFVGYTNYSVDSAGNVFLAGSAFAATNTTNGQRSPSFGRLNQL